MGATGKELFVDRIGAKLNASPDKAKNINAIYEFQLTGDAASTWTVDLTKAADFVSEGSSGNAKCTVTISGDDLASILDKKLNPQMAFMTGKLKVKGDMGLALKLGTIL